MILRAYKNEDAEIIAGWIRTEDELYKWSADRFNKYPLSGDADRHLELHGYGADPGCGSIGSLYDREEMMRWFQFRWLWLILYR